MKLIASAIVIALATSSAMAAPQTGRLDLSVSVPSAQNSGAGIPGFAGNKNGPAVHRGMTVGSTAAKDQANPAIKNQDTAEIAGLPGSKSGPPAKPHGGL
ncbi:hypothetical protein ABID59_001415 [Bradyrhizobium sp. S3.3.6]|uniref:Uncharacterized protein n=1 Tax=Bradyrhizobium cytisi TaxID=515489 RepID=A0A5S4X225_9BRAD|nr:hypothetical protein [Bradyrhizobium cytisi]TYL87723.1 hypothetical protein FXB38_02760 [Bradyrhizobium cytisi]